MSAVVHQLTHVFLLVYAGLFPTVRGEWRGKTQFEAVPAVAIAGGCEIGAVVVGKRGPKHDAVDDELDRRRHVRIRGIAGPASDQPCLRSVEPALQRPVATVIPPRRASRRHTASTFGSSLRRGAQKAQRGASSPG